MKAEASNHETDKSEKKKGSIQIVKLEYVERADDEEEAKRKNPHDINPIPG